MQTIHRNPDERGSAILMVLGILSVVLILAMVFAVTSRNAKTVADAKADQVQAQLLSESAATSVEQVISLFQNKGNLLTNSALEANMPDSAAIDQSMSTLNASAPDKYFYGDAGSSDPTDLLGLQPYVGYVDATNDWKELCLYGELSPRGHANTPFGIDYDPAASEKYYNRSYQSLYYTHGDTTTPYDEVASEGDNSLYEIVANTRLGMAYLQATNDGTTNHFEALLRDDPANQLQFRTTKDADTHIVSRYGYVAFSEGSKFDINQLVMPDLGGSAHTTAVEDGVLVIPASGNAPEIATDGTAVDVGTSTYAVMGYTYDSDNKVDNLFDNGDITETETVQYGIHPQELQTRVVSNAPIYKDNLERGVAGRPSRWFNYDMLTESSVVGADFKDKDLFVYGVSSGAEDKELRFNGQYASEGELQDELLDGAITSMDSITSSGSNFLKKANIAYPWGLYCDETTCDFSTSNDITWDIISGKMRSASNDTDIKTWTEHFFQKHLGINYDNTASAHYLFQDDSSNDLTPQVFANMVDFCDSDNNVTYWAGDGSSTPAKLDFNTTYGGTQLSPLGGLPLTLDIPEPTYCGNERVPAIVGVNVTFNTPNAANTCGMCTEAPSGNPVLKVDHWSTSGLQSTMAFQPVVTLSLQNFFNEKITANQNYRVIVQGKLKPFILAKEKTVTVSAAGAPPVEVMSNVVLFMNNSGKFTDSGCVNVIPNTQTPNPGQYGLLDGTVDFSSDNFSFVIDMKETNVNRTFDELENQSVRIMANPLDYLNILVSPGVLGDTDSLIGVGTKKYYWQVGSGYAVKIEKVVVMAQDFAVTNEISELVYSDASTSDYSVVYGTMNNEALNKTALRAVEPFAQMTTVNGITCKDPRLNHKSSQWVSIGNKNPEYASAGTCFSDSSTNEREKFYKEQDQNSGVTTSGIAATQYGKNFVKKVDSDTPNDEWCCGIFAKASMATVEDALKNDDPSVEKDWEPDFNPGSMSVTISSGYASSKMDTTLSTYFIPNYPFTSLWQLGAIHRGVEGQTINLKKFGTDSAGAVTHKYEDGDSWLLDYLCLNELSNEGGVRGRFNPNCFNAPAYRFLFANIPSNPNGEDTLIYANGMLDPTTNKVVRNDYFKDYVDEAWSDPTENLEDTTFRFRIPGNGDFGGYSNAAGVMKKAQSWSPVQAFFNFVDVNGGVTSTSSTLECNDRQAESLIGCTAGIMSTRYETYTVIAVGQNLKWIMDNNAMPSGTDGVEYRKQLANPVQIGGSTGDWYSILSTEVRLVTLLRDCWFGKITVLKSQVL
ncbi:MAG: hypothetical protein MJ202_03975 [Lentisphaeria bacterium]|nr:hypothetical protein [Lentisphaeria bacterium]